MATGIRDHFATRRGTSNGIPVVHVVANIESASAWQGQTDSFLSAEGVKICGNDYTPSGNRQIRNLFALPGGTNSSDPRPVYAIINCVSNSPSHPLYQVLINHSEPGGGAEDYSVRIAQWRNAIDAVQAPPPKISDARLVSGAMEFTIPGQRGRTNRVEATTNLASWTTVTNVFGTNAPIRVRDPQNVLPGRFYRVNRL